MKLAFFLCALFLSLHGWCASIAPSESNARAIDLGRQTVANVTLHETAGNPLVLDKMQVVMIACGLLAYLVVLSWWAITTKNALDKIIHNVLQDMARYPS